MPDDLEPGFARCPGVSFDDLARADTNPVPDFLLGEGAYSYLGCEPLSVDRYIDSEFFQRELKDMWPNVWQFAAREEELLEPGQTLVFESAGRSYLLVRQADLSVRAFHNVCLHRGRRLRDYAGRVAEFRCPYHGFTWSTDGTLKNIPCEWDFPHLRGRDMSLPEAEVGHWQGYIFIRDNPGGPTLGEYLGPITQHFARFRHDQCYTSAWAAKTVAANWKVCAEAFMEAMHLITTHPQILPFSGDVNSKYFIWGDHANLLLTPFGAPSPSINVGDRGEQWVMNEFLKNNGRVVEPGTSIEVPAGDSARATMGRHNRKRFAAASGRDLSHVSDAEVQDAMVYNVFPNFAPWGGFAPNIVYRWRPWPDQDHTLMEVRILTRLRPGESMKPAVSMTMLGPDQSWAEVYGVLGDILMQDWSNLPAVQAGLRASKNRRIELANYQESKIRHFHQTLDKYLERLLPAGAARG